jgi:hypothetical protein
MRPQVARRGTNSLRARVAELLSSRSDSLILLSATPHDGKRESFASIMNMLNPTAIKDETNYGPSDIEGLFIRRFKKDIKSQVRGSFPDRVVHTRHTAASPDEEQAFTCLCDLDLQQLDGERKTGEMLFKTLLEKSLFSALSPASRRSIAASRGSPTAKTRRQQTASVSALQGLTSTLAEINPDSFSKYQKLLSLLRANTADSIGWTPRNGNDRLVIFTERIATLNWLPPTCFWTWVSAPIRSPSSTAA